MDLLNAQLYLLQNVPLIWRNIWGFPLTNFQRKLQLYFIIKLVHLQVRIWFCFKAKNAALRVIFDRKYKEFLSLFSCGLKSIIRSIYFLSKYLLAQWLQTLLKELTLLERAKVLKFYDYIFHMKNHSP